MSILTAPSDLHRCLSSLKNGALTCWGRAVCRFELGSLWPLRLGLSREIRCVQSLRGGGFCTGRLPGLSLDFWGLPSIGCLLFSWDTEAALRFERVLGRFLIKFESFCNRWVFPGNGQGWQKVKKGGAA
jgi:hypothetical protein